MERPLDIHQTITLAPPPPSSDAGPDHASERRNTPIGNPSSAHMQAALAASSRTEETLNELMRTIQDLARGVGGAREANEHLVQELQTLREMLGTANEQQLALRHRLTVLEQERRGDHRQALAEQSYLQEQYDTFLADLLDDHEQATDELRRERDEAQKRVADLEARLLSVSTQPPPSSKPTLRNDAAGVAADAAAKAEILQLQATVERLTQERERTREALQRLQAQRDEAQAQASKAVRERDAALTATGDIPRSAPHHPAPARKPNVPASTRPTDPPPPGAKPAAQPAAQLGAQPPVIRRPVLELELDVGPSPKGPASAAPQSPRVSKPPLKQKPDPMNRPLIGYSLKDSVAPESLGSSPRHSKPPKP